ncbi:ANTAR domain-containing protein [Streptomyces sp. NPDC001307]|uniref:ANTAR domain-containing protein n=1 Tax=Streptomyces sp. NPDC001307 TaxID=3364560 RepID=UPI0036B83242
MAAYGVPRPTIGDLQEQIGNLEHALTSHAVVDQAIGVVIALTGLSPEEAFEALREVSQRTNVKLKDVAARVVQWPQSGCLPDDMRRTLDLVLPTHRRGSFGQA